MGACCPQFEAHIRGCSKATDISKPGTWNMCRDTGGETHSQGLNQIIQDSGENSFTHNLTENSGSSKEVFFILICLPESFLFPRKGPVGGYTEDNLTSVLLFTSFSCLWSSERNLPQTTKAKTFPLDLTFLVSWLFLLPSFQYLYLKISTILSLSCSFFFSFHFSQATSHHLNVPFVYPILFSNISLFWKSGLSPHASRKLGLLSIPFFVFTY